MSDSPSNHPRIKTEEKEYIQAGIGESVSNKKVNENLFEDRVEKQLKIEFFCPVSTSILKSSYIIAVSGVDCFALR